MNLTSTRFVLTLAIVATACAGEGDRAAPDASVAGGTQGPASATIVTAVAPDTAVANSTGTTPPSPATTLEPDPAASGTTQPGTTQPGTTDATAPPTTPVAPPVLVGNPVVDRELVDNFSGAIDLAVRPGDDGLWIVQQTGQVVRFDGSERTTALDVNGQIRSGGERGLLGLAFSTDGNLAYVNFTDLAGNTVIAEYGVGADGRFDTATARTLLTVDQPFGNHNAGDLEIGPDGMLYIPLGDGGSGGDPLRVGADPSTLLGSMLRIDPMPSDGAEYTIPADNPFANGGAGAPEVWAWGLRNPWKIAFDPLTGELWIADVGQNQFEEINVVAPVDGMTAGRGVDFGWSAFEGTARFNVDVPDTGTMTPPVLTYNHDDGCSISGGVPYRGSAIPQLEPAYVYSDFCSGVIWALDVAGGRNLTLLDAVTGVIAVRAGPDGELYIIEAGGNVSRLVPG